MFSDELKKSLNILIFITVSLFAGSLQAAVQKVLTVAYLELKDDPRYVEKRMAARFAGKTWGRPYGGAEVALRESRFVGASVGVKFELTHKQATNTDELKSTLDTLVKQGVNFVLLDLPADEIAVLSRYASKYDVLLFNVSAADNSLREKQCSSNLLNVNASQTMLADALAQYMIFKKWREVLLLVGEDKNDLQSQKVFQHSAKKFGIKIIDEKSYILGLNPRERKKNNISLLTSGSDYDAVWVIDSTGEFARNVPYQLQKPRLVVGDAGLVPVGWHWAWERHGAPQLNKRFEKRSGRQMTDSDWSAWMSIKIIAEAVLRTKSTELAKLEPYIKGSEIILDGFKGARLSFRQWNNQLRQPMFLTTDNWVVARAPLDGFLHQVNNLDTIGIEKQQSQCKFN